MYTFTATDIFNALKNWKLKSLTKKEKAILFEKLVEKSIYQYALNDIESLILELISE